MLPPTLNGHLCIPESLIADPIDDPIPEYRMEADPINDPIPEYRMEADPIDDPIPEYRM